MTVSRRSLFGFAVAGLAAVSLGACINTKDGSTTTLSLNVEKIKQYANSGINAANIVSGIVGLIPPLEKLSTTFNEIKDRIETDLKSIIEAAGDRLVVSYDDLNYKTKIDSILLNLDRLVNTIEVVGQTLSIDIGNSTKDVIDKVKLVSAALKTIVAIFNGLVDGFVATASNGETQLSEAEALSILDVK